MLEEGFLWTDFHSALSYAMELFMSFLIKDNENTKHFQTKVCLRMG